MTKKFFTLWALNIGLTQLKKIAWKNGWEGFADVALIRFGYPKKEGVWLRSVGWNHKPLPRARLMGRLKVGKMKGIGFAYEHWLE